ncbi:MAG: hypothetical protein KJI71_04660 [Patescibacteria group bacterium]|nr:hypothetical protein [Patescibacteria group bacterium]
MDVQEFNELVKVCTNKYENFKKDFDEVFNSIGDFTADLNWTKEELKANPSLLRSIAIIKTKEEFILLQNFFEKYPEFKPFKENIRDVFVGNLNNEK